MVSEGGVQYLGDGIVSRTYLADRQTEEGPKVAGMEEQMCFFKSLSKTFMTVDVRATGR